MKYDYTIFLILPHQLFRKGLLPRAKKYILYMHSKYYTKKYGMVKYEYTAKTCNAFYRNVLPKGRREMVYSFSPNGACAMFDPIDHGMSKYAKCILPSPSFLIGEITDECINRSKSFATFYAYMGKRVFGKALKSQDAKNRSPLPRNYELPKETIMPNSVDNRSKAIAWLKRFISSRFSLFGKYQDAILPDNSLYGYHSAISPFLNNGLLTPNDVLNYIDTVAGIPRASKEGFIRQLIGWREYVRIIYVRDYAGNGARHNYFGNRVRKWSMADAPPPVRIAGEKMQKYGYIPHIERLMVVALWMNLIRLHPDVIFEWFMQSIDAYDWVMYPNIYGMATYADGGKMMKKPYLASDVYISKMSSGRWDDINTAWKCKWKALYYKFIIDNEEKLKGTPHIRAIYAWKKKSKSDRDNLLSYI